MGQRGKKTRKHNSSVDLKVVKSTEEGKISGEGGARK